MEGIQVTLNLLSAAWPLVAGFVALVVGIARIQWKQKSLEAADRHRRVAIEKLDSALVGQLSRVNALDMEAIRTRETIASLETKVNMLESETMTELKRIGLSLARIEGKLESWELVKPRETSRR